ncbi:MAG: HIT domain-containing protein [Lactobacillus sp.]|nr:HIT domain-containing protein [Lactobacillus sp.]
MAKKDKIIELKLCNVLLEDNANYPWLILVPRIDNAKNMLRFSMEQRLQVMREVALCEEVLAENFACDQTNIATADDEIDQLAIHIVCRQKKDKNWPCLAWGTAAKHYKAEDKADMVNKIEKAIKIKMANEKYMQF